LAIPGDIGIVWGAKQFIETYLLRVNKERID